MGDGPLFVTALERHAGAVILHLRGELDLSTSEELTEALESARPTAGVFVLDLAELRFIDSSGLHLLVGEFRRARADGHELVVAGATGEVRETLRITGLDVILPSAPDHRTALSEP
jgi:anti-sigma B factor antagonist